MPYLSHFSYKFHAEKARESGTRVEDTYEQKFFREPFIAWHVYGQYFHPDTLTERVRNIHVYRKTRTLFKGFKMPDWAQSRDMDGFDTDPYSRKAWNDAWNDMKSEWTPMPFNGPGLEPNAINYFRFEQWGKGISSRFFYNEVPKPTYWRYGGHLEDPEKNLFSFNYADQGSEDLLGFDLTTPEGQKFMRDEIKFWKTITPEMMEKFPDEPEEYEATPYLSTEPHYRRVWNHYRQFQFKTRIEHLIENGDLEADDVSRASKFFDSKGLPSATMFANAQRGVYGDLTNDPSWESFQKIAKWLGLDTIEFDHTTAEPLEEQFWRNFDQIFELTEEDMHKYLPIYVTDPKNAARIEALKAAEGNLGFKESTKKLA